jgi:hypothetical protein
MPCAIRRAKPPKRVLAKTDVKAPFIKKGRCRQKKSFIQENKEPVNLEKNIIAKENLKKRGRLKKVAAVYNALLLNEAQGNITSATELNAGEVNEFSDSVKEAPSLELNESDFVSLEEKTIFSFKNNIYINQATAHLYIPQYKSSKGIVYEHVVEISYFG